MVIGYLIVSARERVDASIHDLDELLHTRLIRLRLSD